MNHKLTIAPEVNSAKDEFAGYGIVAAATDVLLMDYSDEVRKEILEYLFKKGYGPEIKLLKVEIGGGGNDTNIANASFMPLRGQINPYAGYEWKLIKEVKAVNPEVKIQGLHWAMPNWVETPLDEAYYIFSWVKEIHDVHGITVDYIGGQRNEESPIIPEMTIALRKMLDENGFKSVKIVAADAVFNIWKVADVLYESKEYSDAVDIIGVHYVGSDPTEHAKALKKPIWASEDPGHNSSYNSFGNVKKFLANYVDRGITALQTWGLSGSVYENSWWHMIGIIGARWPWCGYWSTGGAGNWAIAHINQFADFGWEFVSNSCGKFNDKSYYVTLKSKDNKDYNVFLETFDQKEAVPLALDLDKKVYVWTTKINSQNEADWFYQEAEIEPVNGKIEYLLEPERVYNFVTTKGQGKKGIEVKIAEKTPWALPITCDFAWETVGQRPRYFVDMEGTFEVAEDTTGRGGKVLRQVAIGTPVRWYGAGTDTLPYALFGYPYWTDYKASIDVRLMNTGYSAIAIRASEAQMKERLSRKGYYIRLYSDGTWKLVMIKLVQFTRKNLETVLAEGKIAAPGQNAWVNIAVSAKNEQISAFINGELAATVTDVTHKEGNIFLETSDYQYAEFANLEVIEIK